MPTLPDIEAPSFAPGDLVRAASQLRPGPRKRFLKALRDLSNVHELPGPVSPWYEPQPFVTRIEFSDGVRRKWVMTLVNGEWVTKPGFLQAGRPSVNDAEVWRMYTRVLPKVQALRRWVERNPDVPPTLDHAQRTVERVLQAVKGSHAVLRDLGVAKKREALHFSMTNTQGIVNLLPTTVRAFFTSRSTASQLAGEIVGLRFGLSARGVKDAVARYRQH